MNIINAFGRRKESGLLLVLIFVVNNWLVAAEQIESIGPMAVARKGHTATVLSDGRVLIVGGRDTNGVIAAGEIFDPVTKAFSLVGVMNVPRTGHTATLLADGRVLIAGGQDETGPLS